MAIALSPISLQRLKTCDPRLVQLMEAVHARQPISILCGHRTQAEQDAAFFAKKSKVKFPGSKHNALPALAVDICPIKANWNDKTQFIDLSVIVKEEAAKLGLNIKWGGDFKSFFDGPHYELV